MKTIALAFLLPALVSAAIPTLVADAQAEDILVRAGAQTFGRTNSFLLVVDEPLARQALRRSGSSYRGIALEPDEPAYLVYSIHRDVSADAARLGRVLLEDGDCVLVQISEKDALKVAQLGGELVRLPEEPLPIRRAPGYGYPLPTFTDTLIQRLIGEVSADSIHEHIQRLQDVRTRYSPTDSCRAAEQHLYDYFVSLGFDSVALDSYVVGGDTWRNVEATKLGTVRPDKIFIICGHMDAISEDSLRDSIAPGAEDNGSGTSMAIEAGRVLADEELDYTVKFLAFTGEEIGLNGSAHYAAMMRSRGADIIGVMNFDMVAWPGGRWGVRLVGLPRAQWLVQLQARMATLYTALGHEIHIRSFPSDSRSFEEQGYIATSGYEYGTEPYIWYHTTGDTLGNISMELAEEVCQMSVATLAMLGRAPLSPEGFSLRDVGTGSELLATWEPNAEPDLAGYLLRWGTVSRRYTDSVVVGRTTSRVISGLEPDTQYFATVMALDSAGNLGGWSEEDSAIPGVVPQPPAGVEAWPFAQGMELVWLGNRELDLAGYNAYRSTVSGSGYVRMNGALLADTVFRDSGLVSDTMYYYVMTAVDTGDSESGYSTEVQGKPITLDHGILLVDETRDGNGNQGSPSDEQQDGFYHAVLEGYQYSDWDVAGDGIPLAGDVGPYSTIVWHGDEYQQLRLEEAIPGIANYLTHGGRLWLTGWKPVLATIGGSAAYPYEFVPGQLLYDYGHLARAEQSERVDFTGATGVGEYPGVELDSNKVLRAMHGRLPYVDALLPGEAVTMLTFNSASGDTFQGKPVGVIWTSGPGRVAALGFPFFYTVEEQARLLAREILEALGEPYAVSEGPDAAVPGLALEVGPNPARGAVRIRYSLPSSGPVRLGLYDIAGKQVWSRVYRSQAAGAYVASVAARTLPAGVYFCQLVADGRIRTVRLELAH